MALMNQAFLTHFENIDTFDSQRRTFEQLCRHFRQSRTQLLTRVYEEFEVYKTTNAWTANDPWRLLLHSGHQTDIASVVLTIPWYASPKLCVLCTFTEVILLGKWSSCSLHTRSTPALRRSDRWYKLYWQKTPNNARW